MPNLVNKTCEWCKKPFQVIFKLRNQRFCSLSCTGKYGNRNKRRAFEKPCNVCGKMFRVIPARIEDGRGKYCSKACYSVVMKGSKRGIVHSEETRIKLSQMRIGELNPAFKHGLSNNAKRYKGLFSRLIKEKILTRDNHECVECFTNKSLVVHHLDENPLNNEFNNLITVCRSCHLSCYHLSK